MPIAMGDGVDNTNLRQTLTQSMGDDQAPSVQPNLGAATATTTPLRTGVSAVRYSVALDACAPFAVEPEIIDTVIDQGVEEWTN